MELPPQGLQQGFANGILDSVLSSIVVTDPNLPDNPVVYVNSAFEEATGYSSEEVVGHNCRFLQDSERSQPSLQELREALEEGREWSGIVRNYRKSGELFYNELSISPMRDSEDRITHFIGVQKDVNERAEANAGTTEVSQEFKITLESITDAFFALDKEARFTYLNSEAERVLSRSRGELVGRNVWEAFPEAVQLPLYTEARRATEERVTVEFESYYPPLRSWFEVKVYPSEGGASVFFRDISERKRAEAEREQAEQDRRKSEERLRSVLAGYGSEIITILDSEGNITYESPAVEQILGYKQGERNGEKGPDNIHPDDIERVAEAFATAMGQDGVSPTVEYRLRHANGSWVWLEGIANNLLQEASIEGIVVNSRDITDRKLAEQELRSSEQRNRAILEASPDVMFRVDREGVALDFHANDSSILLAPPEQMVGSSVRDIMPPDVASNIHHCIDRTLATGEIQLYEFQLPLSQGPRYFEARFVIGGEDEVLYFARDITERKLAEEELRSSEERYRTLAEATFEGLIISEGGEVLDVNPAGAATLGYEPQEMIGMGVLDFISPEYHELARQKIAAGSEEPYGVTALRKDNTPVELEVRGKDFHYRGRPVRVTASRDVSEQKALERRLRHQAMHDALTGLANRVLFMDRLAKALERPRRREEYVVVLFLDLDNFKHINDSLGHSTGDKLLVSVAHRLSSCLRASDTVARLGGDEFTILLDGVSGEEEAYQIAGRIISQFRSAVALSGAGMEHEVYTTVSIGLTITQMGAVNSAEELLRRADAALYQAKAEGKDQYLLFSQEMQESSVSRLDLESEIRRARDRGSFLVHYQPVVALESGQTCGMEALVRLPHLVRGTTIPPAEFIPLAEETGLIIDIGRQVLEEACRQASLWHAQYPSVQRATISVNLSARQLRHHELVEDVSKVLRDTGLSPESLELEITESVLMEDEKTGFAKVMELKELGVKLALDDFGTGYSSLSYLKQLPIDTLKIDRSFIWGLEENPEDKAFIEAIVSLAQTLGIAMVSEGVETSRQLDVLHEIGVGFAQGYYFARPMPGERTSEYIG